MSRNGLLSANDCRAYLILEAYNGTSGTMLLSTRRTRCVISMIPRRVTVHHTSPGYNAQTAVDAKRHLIVADEVIKELLRLSACGR